VRKPQKDRARTEDRISAGRRTLPRRTVDLKKDVYRLKQERRWLEDIEERYKALFDRSVCCVYIHDLDGNFLEANQAAFDMLGYTRDEILSLNFASIVDPCDLSVAYQTLKEILRTGSQQRPNEFKLRKKNGEPVWVLTEASLIYRGGRPFAVQGIALDVTARKSMEQALQASLQDKEVLLREIHHRVKNNLQIISSLLDMKSMRSMGRRMAELCRDAQAKIHTMALIHTHLCQGENLTWVHMGKYTRDLVGYLAQAYSEESKSVSPVIKPSELFLSITQAIPCAIVINEAVSNAFKHGFKKGQTGKIEISLERDAEETAVIRVRDDGRGLARTIDPARADTLGLKLMRNLVEDQLQGEFRIRRSHGTEVFIKFKILSEE
jgi:PAS domain S-box-containing protein